MANTKKNKSASKSLPLGEVAGSVRQVDVYFNKYADSHQNHSNELIHWVCVPLIVFSLLGLVWSIPFPHIGFLGRYNGFVNWASFLIAFSIYYYYRLSPVLSYCMLLLIFIFSYFIIGLENWQHAGGPMLWQSCLVVFALSWVGQFIGHKIEGKKPSFFDDIKFLLIGPIWLLHFVLLKLKIKY
ncbi:putative membrane protein YGL010W [Mucilaginibacter gracilis]|uniref:Putative membrane protein YGL010W n=1 Tax=Mucilaginibacter gracilis TaxID=423350 RepID=A0A495IZV1_9SPHI|nr:Mpo1-like protein [Mucilaginibacter gracilis]RKR82217.1 putative membrane protein YGL010W [Mucilaginibacter gracilis]